MKKVYVCFTIPDYIGIDIKAIFDSEQKAIEFCNVWNADKDHKYMECDHIEFEVN